MPDLGPGSVVGAPLQAQLADIVTWGNQTDQTHQPWPLDAQGNPVPSPYTGAKANYLSDPIEPGGSSFPQFVVTGTVGTTISYCCLNHKDDLNERGQIAIVANFT